MFPITLSSVGDIIAVAQLLFSVVKALKDSTGAAQVYSDFVYRLEALASVMEEVGRRAQDSSNEKLKRDILNDVRRCCSDLDRAGKLVSGFEALLQAHSPDAPSSLDLRDRVALAAKKLRWYFTKNSEASSFTHQFRDWCALIHLRITLLNDDDTQVRSEQHATYMRTNVALTLDEIARLSKSLDLTRRSIESRLQDIEDASRFVLSRVVGELHGMKRTQREHAQSVSENFGILKLLQEDRTQTEVRARLLSAVFPVCVISGAFILANPAYIPTDNRLRFYTLWLALGATVVNSVIQAVSIPRTIGYGVENSIIFVDFVGATMKIPPELCGTMDDFCDLVKTMFTRKKRRGWSFVQTRDYEIIECSSSDPLTSSSWPTQVRAGVKIQLGAIVRRRGLEVEGLTCPYCGIEVFRGATNDARDWLFCEGCRKSFQASTAREKVTVPEPSASMPGKSSSENRRSGRTNGSDKSRITDEALSGNGHQEPRHKPSAVVGNEEELLLESIVGFEHVHVSRIVTEYRVFRLVWHSIYSEELSWAFHKGIALHDPRPGTTPDGRPLPRVEIGDVGYISPHGRFVRLFNLHRVETCEVGSPTRNNLPRGAEMASPDRSSGPLVSKYEFTCHLSRGVKCIRDEPGHGIYTFKSSQKTGAILITADTTYSLQTSRAEAYREHAKKHVQSWYEFALKKSHGIFLSELVLVTGVDRTTSWALAAFDNGAELEEGFGIEFSRAGEGRAARYDWKHSRDVWVDSETGVSASPESGPWAPACNQTLFIRGLRAKRRKYWDGLTVKPI